MTTKQFIKKLNDNKNKELIFEYAKNKYAGTNYHLTEIKNVQFNSVDCGGNINNWKETHLQLWENPLEIGKENYMMVDKVIAIIEKVNSINPLWQETDIKIEFGNEDFHTSIMNIAGFVESNNKVIVQLFSEKTLCKAPSICSTNQDESCCETDKIEETSCCTNSVCC